MNLKEIVFRDYSKPITQEECIFVIREYIKTRKGVDVKPRLKTNFGEFGAIHELSLMIDMTNHAISWFRGNE